MDRRSFIQAAIAAASVKIFRPKASTDVLQVKSFVEASTPKSDFYTAMMCSTDSVGGNLPQFCMEVNTTIDPDDIRADYTSIAAWNMGMSE